MILRTIALLILIVLAGGLDGKEMTEKFGKIEVTVDPPNNFIRIDDSETDLAEVIRAGVPQSNHLFAAYVDRNSVLDRKGGEAATPYPYFMVQAQKTAAIQGGVKGLGMTDLLDIMAKQGGEPIQMLNATDMQALRKRVDKALQVRLGEGVEMKQPKVQIAGAISRSDRHVTLLLHGTAQFKFANEDLKDNFIATCTLLDVGGMPVFLYVYDKDDHTADAINQVVNLTSKLVSCIKSPKKTP